MANTPPTGTGSAKSPGSDPKRDLDKAAARVDQEKQTAAAEIEKAKSTAASEASAAAERAQRLAKEQAEGAKQQASESLDAFAKAVRSAGDELGDRDQGTAARFVRQAAGSLENITHSLNNTRVEDMLREIRGFGRRNPTAFIAGSVLAGIALGRFVRSSAEAREEDDRLAHRSSPSGSYSGARTASPVTPGTTPSTPPRPAGTPVSSTAPTRASTPTTPAGSAPPTSSTAPGGTARSAGTGAASSTTSTKPGEVKK